MSSPFVNVSQLSICFQLHIPKPSYDPINPNCIVLSTNYNESQTTPGIYKYNMETNESEMIYKYDNTVKPCAHGQFIDVSNNTVILYGGLYQIFKIFDLNTNVMKQPTHTNIINRYSCNPQNTFIPSPINQIHIFKYTHYKFDIATKSTMQLNSCAQLIADRIRFPKLLYIESKKKLFIFGSHRNNKIFSCDIDTNTNQTEYQWKINTLNMPYYSVQWSEYEILHGFTNILFVFYFNKSELNQIYLLDLLNDKWFKAKYCLPNHFKHNICRKNCFVMKYKHDAYIMNFDHKQNFKVNLFDLIPKELIILHRKHFKGLIIGYCKEIEQTLSLPGMPFVLKILILNYFQLFE